MQGPLAGLVVFVFGILFGHPVADTLLTRGENAPDTLTGAFLAHGWNSSAQGHLGSYGWETWNQGQK